MTTEAQAPPAGGGYSPQQQAVLTVLATLTPDQLVQRLAHAECSYRDAQRAKADAVAAERYAWYAVLALRYEVARRAGLVSEGDK